MTDRGSLAAAVTSQGNVDDLLSQLRTYEDRSLLRFLMCGSVDDGKSTLIGRLLFESHKLYSDQLAALEEDSRRFGTTGGDLDFALLMDGLAAEREQGITIDVAYRFFSTERRHFIVADTPGHEQYTRNMVTGASNSECAVILVDASSGVVTQTRRHTHIVSLLGIRQVAIAINKMDLVGYDMHRFEEIEGACRAFAAEVGLDAVTCIPVSGLKGDNVVHPSEHLQWFHGPTLMGYLETVEVETDERLHSAPLRLPVQWVNRASADFRGFAGEIVAGSVAVGDAVTVVPSGKRSRIARIVTPAGDAESAGTGEAVTVTLEDEIDVSRGDILAADAAAPEVADQFEATIVWMDERPMFRGRNYLMRVGTRTVTATIAPLKYKVNVDTLERIAATKLELNEIGVCELELGQAIGFDSYRENREMGGFVLIDRITNDTVGAGMIHFALRRSHNIPFQPLSVDKLSRARIMQQKPCVIWLTGLSGAGKSTIANLVEVELHRRGHYTYLLDGDNVRHGLNRDLGFTETDRVENVRRVAEVAKLMVDAGLIVIVSFISPFRSERQTARSLVREDEFIEVFVDTPLAVAEARDPKGLYRKARLGELENFTGISSPYEPPERPELRIDTTSVSAEQGVETVLALLEERGVIAQG